MYRIGLRDRTERALHFDSIVWQKLNELTGDFEATNFTTAEFTPTQPGVYRLKGVLECTNID